MRSRSAKRINPHTLTFPPAGSGLFLAETVGLSAEAPEPSIRVVQNWFAEFRDREQD